MNEVLGLELMHLFGRSVNIQGLNETF